MHALQVALTFAVAAAIGRFLYSRRQEVEMQREQLARWRQFIADAESVGFRRVDPGILAREDDLGRVRIFGFDPGGRPCLTFDHESSLGRDAGIALTVFTEVGLPKMCVFLRAGSLRRHGIERQLGNAFARRYLVDPEGSAKERVHAALESVAALLTGAPIHRMTVDVRRDPKTLVPMSIVSLYAELRAFNDDFDLAAMLEILRRFVTAASQPHSLDR